MRALAPTSPGPVRQAVGAVTGSRYLARRRQGRYLGGDMTTLNDTIRANRFDVFRHTLCSIALASASASGMGIAAISGCVENEEQHGVPWIPPCAAYDSIPDLTGLPLPDGVDGLGVYTEPGLPVLSAGDFCQESTDCILLDVPLDPESPYTIFVRRDAVLERSSLDELLAEQVVTPQEAVLLVFTEEGEPIYCYDSEHFNGQGRGPQTGRVVPVSGGFEVVLPVAECGELVGSTYFVRRSGEVGRGRTRVVGPTDCPVTGRLTAGVTAPVRPASGRDLGRYFAQAAALEAAAVDAFERMAAELDALGAPEGLVQWARASADDERRHTRDMGLLAESFSASPLVHAAQTFPLRGLFEVALENAVEGCVRETYGAVVGHHQAERAQNEVVRTAMLHVAEDETRHAALSWAVAEWALPQLSEPERMEIRRAQRAAIETLALSVSAPQGDMLVSQAGLPTPETAVAMLRGLRQHVWA